MKSIVVSRIVNRLIHMNGRFYSPSLGGMLSPDPVTQAPENGQNYNRYTYAFNNPLKFTDPSGYEVEGKNHDCVERINSAGPMEEVVVNGGAAGGGDNGGGSVSPGDVQRASVGGSPRGEVGDRSGSGG